MREETEKPKHRSDLRIYFGKKYFSLRRHIRWLFGGFRFAKLRDEKLNYPHYTHSTPLLRKLRNVDMYMQHNKIINLGIALKKVNNVVLYPGETFSYWKLIGKPTRLKGYREGMVLQLGTVKAGTGGGLCQLSNLIYWLTVHTPLTVTERHRHGFDVFPDSNRSQPFGSGATCLYNYVDLMIKNNTGQKFQLQVEMNEGELKGSWMSDFPPNYRYEVYEREHFFQTEYWGGVTRHNLLYRRVYDLDDILLADEYVVENHAITMYSPFLPDGEDKSGARGVEGKEIT